MVLNRTIQIRLTKEQYDRINQNARLKGFQHTSAYLRYVGLEQDLWLHRRIQEIHQHLLGEEKAKRRKKTAEHRPFL